jgi:WD40 repeat protein
MIEFCLLLQVSLRKDQIMNERLWVVNGRQVLLTSFVVLFVAGALLAADENKETTQEEAKEEAPKEETIASHERWVTSLAFSADGSTLVTGGGQSLQYRPGDVKIWDVASGSLVKTLGTIHLDDKGDAQGKGHKSNVWSVALSPDGSRLVTSGYNGEVIVWNVAEGTPIAMLDKHKGWCRAVAYHPGGSHFATAGEDGTVVVWEAGGPKEIKEIKEIKAHESAVYDLEFSPDGKTLATASTDKTVKLFDWETGKENAKLEGHEDAVWAVTYSKDGSLIATGGADRKIKLWDANGALKTTLAGHKDWVTSIAFSPDGKQLAAADYGRTVKLWNIELAINLADEVNQTAAKLKENMATVEQATKEQEDAEPAAETTKKKAAAVAAVLDTRQLPEELKQLEAALVVAKDNRFIKKAIEEAKAAVEAANKAAAEQTKALEGDKEFSEKLKKIKEGPLAEAIAEHAAAGQAAVNAAAKVKAAVEKKAAADKAVGEAKQKGRELAEQQAKTLPRYKSSVWCVSFSADGKLVATGSHKDSIKIWNVADATELFPRPADESSSDASKESAKGEE